MLLFIDGSRIINQDFSTGSEGSRGWVERRIVRILLDYNRQRNAPAFKYLALQRTLCAAIERKDYDFNERLPSIRAACRLFKLSKSTVLNAYELLCADGYVEGVQRKGYFVTYTTLKPWQPEPFKISLSTWGRRLSDVAVGAAVFSQSSCRVLRRWVSALMRAFRELNFLLSEERVPEEGLPELRERVAAYLFRMRRLRVTPEEVLIAGGLEQSFALLSQLLVEPGERVEIGDNTPGFAMEMIRLAGGVGGEGLASRLFCSGPLRDVKSRFAL